MFAIELFRAVLARCCWPLACVFRSVMRYYMHYGPATFRFELAGELDANDAATLEQDWRAASSIVRARRLIVDLSFVTRIDAAARSLLKRWHLDGAEFAANSMQSRELVESITERPFTHEPPHFPTDRSWFPLGQARCDCRGSAED